MPSRKIISGQVREVPKNVEETRTIPFTLSNYSKDRHGTVLNQDNWKLDNYRNNPIVGYQHYMKGSAFTDPNPDYIIGKDLNPHIEGIGTNRILAGVLHFEPADINPMAEKIFRKVLFGSLSSTSVGFMEIGHGKYGQGEEGPGRSQETYYFDGQELLEWSVVNIPSNPGAGKRKRTLRDEGVGPVSYVMQQLGDHFRPSDLEKLSIDDIMLLLEAKDLGINEKDPDKVRKLLKDPQVQDVIIEMERAAFRKAKDYTIKTRQTPESETNNEKNNFTTQKKSIMKKRLLLTDRLNAYLNKSELDKDWRDVDDKARNDLILAGLGNLALGDQINLPIQERAIWEADSGNTSTLPLYGLPPAGSLTTMAKAGATVITGFPGGNAVIPSANSVIAGWLGQTAANQNAAGGLNSILLSPLRLQAWFDISKLVLLMGGQAANDYLIGLLIEATANKLEETALGVLARSAVHFQSMGYKCTVGTNTLKPSTVPTLAVLTQMENEVATLKAYQGKLAWITSPKGKGILRRTMIEVGQTESVLQKGGLINDLPVFVSQWASDAAGSGGNGSLLLFGNWADLMICQFGSYLITIDQNSQARANKVRIFVDSFWDVRGMRFPAASTGSGTDNDEYVGFSSLPIKISS